MAVVVASKALEKTHDEATRLGRAVGQLMASPVVFPYGDENVLVDVEWLGQPLGENVHDVFVAVGSIIELDTKGALPLLRLENVLSIGCVEDETFEIDLAYAAKLG